MNHATQMRQNTAAIVKEQVLSQMSHKNKMSTNFIAHHTSVYPWDRNFSWHVGPRALGATDVFVGIKI